ncbi:hypothetical protein BG011_001936, partial [Mortierella polycephala]
MLGTFGQQPVGRRESRNWEDLEGRLFQIETQQMHDRMQLETAIQMNSSLMGRLERMEHIQEQREKDKRMAPEPAPEPQ